MTPPTQPPRPKQRRNEDIQIVYVVFLCCLIFCVISACRWRSLRRGKRQQPSWRSSPYRRVENHARRALLFLFNKFRLRPTWEWLGRPSVGLVTLVGIFLAVNAILCSTWFASHALNHFASRYGWMSAANMALCVFFAMKNTPLSLVSPVSHAELIIFHRIIGYAAVFLIFLHTIFYTVHLARQGRLSHLLEPSDLAGIGAGIAMFVLLLTGLLRHGRYEWFFVGHIAGFMVVPGLVVLHRPNPAKKLPYVMLFTACLWILDRVIRTTKLSWNSVNNSVTCHPLPGGGTRLLLKKPSIKGAAPGSHCYLWIPRVRFFQLHPFTIVSNGPSGLELIVKPHQGFTKALNDFTIEHPGRTAWVSIDGPYGSLPDTAAYDKLVLIAGGSGAAFTFALMNRILHLSGRLTSQSIDFAWAVRHTEHLGWFGEHLRDLQNFSTPTVNISLNVTNDGRDTVGGEEIVVLPKIDEYERKSETGEAEPLLHAGATRKTKDDLKALVAFKKLDAGALVRSRLLDAKSHYRVLIIACGPSSLMNAVRDTADECRRETSCRVDIHCEDFGGS